MTKRSRVKSFEISQSHELTSNQTQNQNNCHQAQSESKLSQVTRDLDRDNSKSKRSMSRRGRVKPFENDPRQSESQNHSYRKLLRIELKIRTIAIKHNQNRSYHKLIEIIRSQNDP